MLCEISSCYGSKWLHTPFLLTDQQTKRKINLQDNDGNMWQTPNSAVKKCNQLSTALWETPYNILYVNMTVKYRVWWLLFSVCCNANYHSIQRLLQNMMTMMTLLKKMVLHWQNLHIPQTFTVNMLWMGKQVKKSCGSAGIKVCIPLSTKTGNMYK